MERITVQQENESVTESIVEVDAVVRVSEETTVPLGAMSDSRNDPEPPSYVTANLSQLPTTPVLAAEPTVILHRRPEATSKPGCPLQAERVPDVSARVDDIPVTATGDVSTLEPTCVIVLVDEFGRDTCVVNEVCQMIEEMPRPWSAYRVFEGATARFPNIDRAALRRTVLAVLMGQRRCINRMTTAGMQSGRRCDEDGEIYLELNNTCANEYRNSF